MKSDSKLTEVKDDVMEEDNSDLTTIMDIESSGDPKRDKVYEYYESIYALRSANSL
jgi:hypothetical protein